MKSSNVKPHLHSALRLGELGQVNGIFTQLERLLVYAVNDAKSKTVHGKVCLREEAEVHVSRDNQLVRIPCIFHARGCPYSSGRGKRASRCNANIPETVSAGVPVGINKDGTAEISAGAGLPGVGCVRSMDERGG
jgi:hypothetical protein